MVAQNGGADLLYWTGPADRRTAALARMRAIAEDQPGVLSVRAPSRLRLGPEAGDLVVWCQAGWRFSDPEYVDNPIPGNHGHPATRPIPFFLSGGSDRVPRRSSSSKVARTMDVAPTVGKLFGLTAPRGGYDAHGVRIVSAAEEAADWMVTAARTRPVRIAPRMAVTAKAIDSVAPGLLGAIMKRGVTETS